MRDEKYEKGDVLTASNLSASRGGGTLLFGDVGIVYDKCLFLRQPKSNEYKGGFSGWRLFLLRLYDITESWNQY